MVEWGAKTIPEGGFHAVPKRRQGHGLLIAGDHPDPAILKDGADAFHDIRKVGNRAVHEHYADSRVALDAVNKCLFAAGSGADTV